jgi:hypothetical protein
MKEILKLVEQRQHEFAQLPLFQYVQDTNIDPRQRLIWVPCLAPLSLGFGDLWQDILRRETQDDALQMLINRHTREDENHWKWYISDLKTLGFLDHFNFTDSLSFLWNESTPKVRRVCLRIAGLTYTADPVVVLAAIEALEATANVVFSRTANVIKELPTNQQKGLRYFGHVHLEEDASHAIFDADFNLVENLELTKEQRIQAVYVVESLFQCFEEAFQEIMQYVNQQNTPAKIPALV